MKLWTIKKYAEKKCLLPREWFHHPFCIFFLLFFGLFSCSLFIWFHYVSITSFDCLSWYFLLHSFANTMLIAPKNNWPEEIQQTHTNWSEMYFIWLGDRKTVVSVIISLCHSFSRSLVLSVSLALHSLSLSLGRGENLYIWNPLLPTMRQQFPGILIYEVSAFLLAIRKSFALHMYRFFVSFMAPHTSSRNIYIIHGHRG